MVAQLSLKNFCPAIFIACQVTQHIRTTVKSIPLKMFLTVSEGFYYKIHFFECYDRIVNTGSSVRKTALLYQVDSDSHIQYEVIPLAYALKHLTDT